MTLTAGAGLSPRAEDTSEYRSLVEAARLGDAAAFTALYARFARMVHGILLSRVQRMDVEDLVQDVFVTALQQCSAPFEIPQRFPAGWPPSLEIVRRTMRGARRSWPIAGRSCGADARRIGSRVCDG